MFSPEALKNGILSCKANIITFEDAIEKERETIKEYQGMIDSIEEKERDLGKAKADLNSRVEVETDGG
jgi:hypothetical protein